MVSTNSRVRLRMKTPFDEIFEQLDFSEPEKQLFMDCLELVRIEQLEGKDPTSDIIAKVKAVMVDEG